MKVMKRFVNKELFLWSASITLDNNNYVLTGIYLFFSLYTIPHPSVGLASCISIVFFSLKMLLCVILKADSYVYVVKMFEQRIIVSFGDKS